MTGDYLEKYTAGSQSLGFDYQFYYFVYLLLQLKQGEKIGYEVKDDIHIEKTDGTIVLMQAKHTVQTNSGGLRKNITVLDNGMWKTLSIWAKYVASIEEQEIKKCEFVFITNQNDEDNEFITCISNFQLNLISLQDVKNKILFIQNTTTNKTIRTYIDEVYSLTEKKLQLYLERITFKANTDDIIKKIKDYLKERLYQPENNEIEQSFDNLISNLLLSKYIVLDEQKKFELTFEEFTKKFRKCFEICFSQKHLPKRQVALTLPDNMANQIFIRQLLDIGDVENDSVEISTYSFYMLKAFNQFQYWIQEGWVLPTEASDFENNSILIWKNEFKSKYREIQNKISKGVNINALEDDIKLLAINLLDTLRRESLQFLNDDLGVELSNGYYYWLSNEPKIGWHFNWETKYGKTL